MSRYHLGQLAFWEQDFDAVVAHTGSESEEVSQPLVKLLVGCARWNMAQEDEAVDIWRSTPNAQFYFISRALRAEYERAYDVSEVNYRIAMRVIPGWGEAESGYWFAYCMNLLQESDTSEVDVAVREAIWRNLKSYRRQLRLGQMLMQENEFELARLALKLAIGMEPESHWPRYFLGITHYSQHSYELAEVQFTKVLEIEPDFARGHHWLARTLAQLDRCEEAILHYRRAIELLPEDQDLVEEFQGFECKREQDLSQ
jgi:tetratricopeptide (TPR) repeat protein